MERKFDFLYFLGLGWGYAMKMASSGMPSKDKLQFQFVIGWCLIDHHINAVQLATVLIRYVTNKT